VNAGIEGYGWGALSIHLLVRYVLGLQEEEVDRLTVRPAFPQALRRTGATYHIGPVAWGRYFLRIQCTVKDAKRYQLRLRCVVPAEAGENLEGAQEEATQQETQEYQCAWEGVWGEGRTLQLPELSIASI
jgi:hypothetical protein